LDTGDIQVPEGFSLRKIDLLDPLGELYLVLPGTMENYLQWFNASDCQCCGHNDYRFIREDQQPAMESGWVKFPVADSLYQITFFHSDLNCPDRPGAIAALAADLLDDIQSKNVQFRFVFAEKADLAGFDGFMVGYKVPSIQTRFDSISIVEALVYIDPKLVRIEAQCKTHDCNGFIEQMKVAILSIRYQREN